MLFSISRSMSLTTTSARSTSDWLAVVVGYAHFGEFQEFHGELAVLPEQGLGPLCEMKIMVRTLDGGHSVKLGRGKLEECDPDVLPGGQPAEPEGAAPGKLLGEKLPGTACSPSTNTVVPPRESGRWCWTGSGRRVR